MTRRTEFDDDNPEWTREDFARARPAHEVHPMEIVAQLIRPGLQQAVAAQGRYATAKAVGRNGVNLLA